ncbi:hypothetical protein [Mycobacterium xenopi]|uniref:Transmembrane protein n=1 Tax=Mycobacterium xenopi TaxID=1789 RepID=A0AAD1M1T0_MYCXE|nr:hypothetical protein [Mycobacterium xenopi]MDA3639438.1 hypothetical protein [Mycobacterium xenopi]MDA3658284.1 hypothetical protein [Mycobacterium xenopi]MDA3662039.1 hypothetical protein [Mycobacterium xenopi]ORX20567.1 hypothetical protein AWC32_05445 [Mycobacterium xenopi]SPX89053.1 Uncharacterised protein [Mycobacterium xenopi]
MAGGAAKYRWTRVVRYSFGGALCLLAVVNVLIGSAWYLSLGIAVTGGIILFGQRRIFRAAVSRSGDEIICRYIPWYEGNAYSTLVLIPLMGVAMVAAGSAPGYPAWLAYGGAFLLLGVTPLTLYGIVRMWLRCLLHITPSALVVRFAERGSELTEIRRELIESIEPRPTPQPVSGTWLEVAITYRPVEAGSVGTKTVIIGLRLTVQPINLLNALVVWKDSANENPSELLDRVELVLRGRSMAGV